MSKWKSIENVKTRITTTKVPNFTGVSHPDCTTEYKDSCYPTVHGIPLLCTQSFRNTSVFDVTTTNTQGRII